MVSSIKLPSEAKFCESAEAGHSNHSDSNTVAQLLGMTAAPIRMDSQCKYASIARGDASIYLRLPTIKGYEEKIWVSCSLLVDSLPPLNTNNNLLPPSLPPPSPPNRTTPADGCWFTRPEER